MSSGLRREGGRKGGWEEEEKEGGRGESPRRDFTLPSLPPSLLPSLPPSLLHTLVLFFSRTATLPSPSFIHPPPTPPSAPTTGAALFLLQALVPSSPPLMRAARKMRGDTHIHWSKLDTGPVKAPGEGGREGGREEGKEEEC